MLPRQFRLPPTISLHNVTTIVTPYALCKLSKNEFSFNRYGFIVSKKVDKRAAVRNSTKRKVRQCIETRQEQIKKGYDMLVIINKRAVDAKQSDICDILTTAFIKQQIL